MQFIHLFARHCLLLCLRVHPNDWELKRKLLVNVEEEALTHPHLDHPPSNPHALLHLILRHNLSSTQRWHQNPLQNWRMDQNLQQNCPFDGQLGCWQGFSYRESGIEEKWVSERVANHSEWKICWSHSSNRTISTGSECCSSPALVKNQSIGNRWALKVRPYPYIWSISKNLK